MAIFKDDPLLHPPGSKYSYSSYGYNLLSAVIENASGESFLKCLEKHVFTPLGMNHTESDNIYAIVPDRGRYYVVNNGTLINTPAVDNNYKWAGGGLLSTSNDLVRFGFAHMHNDFLKEETIELLWTSPKTTSGEKRTMASVGDPAWTRQIEIGSDTTEDPLEVLPFLESIPKNKL